MNAIQKSNSITLWLCNKSGKTDNYDVMRINMFAMDFVGSGATTPEKVEAISSYKELPFSISREMLFELINHPCNPVS